MLRFVGEQRKAKEREFQEKWKELNAKLNQSNEPSYLPEEIENRMDFIKFHDEFVHYTQKRVKFKVIE